MEPQELTPTLWLIPTSQCPRKCPRRVLGTPAVNIGAQESRRAAAKVGNEVVWQLTRDKPETQFETARVGQKQRRFGRKAPALSSLT